LASRVDASSVLEGYTIALNLLPQVAWLGQTIQVQHSKLAIMDKVACEAAAAAISAEKYDTALEWLEQGRSIVWNQLLQLRTPVDALCDVQPALANDLLQVSKALEHSSSHGSGTQNLSTQSNDTISLEEVAQGHHRLAEQWEVLVKKVQDIPGFEDFLQPKKLAQLCSAAVGGPVVVVNVHKDCCDALILMAGLDEVIHVQLDQFSYKKAEELHQSLNQLLLAADLRKRDTRHMRHRTANPDVGFSTILSNLWLYVVKPVLDSLALTVSLSLSNDI
jgi:hypothetical protein